MPEMPNLSRSSSAAKLPSHPALDRGLEIMAALLLVAALLLIQALIGGTRLIFAFPAFILVALAGLIAALRGAGGRRSADSVCLWSTCLFFGYALVRAIFSPSAYLARSDIALILAGLIVYFLTACFVISARTRLWILAGLLAASFAHVFVGAIQFRGGSNFMPIHFLQRFDYGYRASGFYICPDHLAGLLEVLALFGLSIAAWSRWPVWAKMLVGYTTLACLFGVLITGSRGGYLSVAAGLSVFALLSLRILLAAGVNRVTLAIGGVGAMVAVTGMILALLVVRHSEHLSERARTAVAASDFRFGVWRAALEQWKLQPIVGTGSRSYMFYGRRFRAPNMQRDPVYAHNDYLQLLAEYGVAGALAFLVFFAAHLRHGWRDARRLGPKRIAASHRLLSNAMALNLAALSALAAYAVHSLVDFNLHIPANALLLAFVFGILANSGVTFESSQSGSPSRFGWWRAILIVLVGAIGVLIARFARAEYFGERARAALRDYRFLSAINDAQTAAKEDPRNPIPYYYLGRARVLGGDRQREPEGAASFYRAALPAFERAWALEPRDETYAVELALTYDLLGRFPEAEWLFGEALALDSKSAALNHYYQGHLERWSGQVPKPSQ